MPFGSSKIDASHRVKVIDNDTSSEILCQEDNRVSDVNSSTRFESLTCVTAAATANEQKSLSIYSSNTTPVTGVDITLSDINTYFSSISYDLPVTFQNLNGSGNDYTASLNTGLTSGHAGWVNRTTPTVLGMYRSGGGLVTEYLVYVPATHSGTPDAQMNVLFDVACYKTSRAQVDSGNPILGCRIDEINRNAFAQITSPVDDWFGLCVGASCSVANLPNSNPSVILTMSQNTTGNTLPTSANTSFFTANHQGKLISNGTGVAVIDGFTNGTTATVAIYKNFASNVIGAGTYTLFGTQLPYGASFKYRTYVGFAHAQPDVEQGQVYLGSAWDNGTLTGGPGTYLISTGAIFNYNFAPSVYNSTGDYAILASMGTNPSGYGAGQDGLSPLYLETTGGRADLGVIPDYNAGPFLRYDDKAAPIIFGQAARWGTMSTHYIDQNTGMNLTPCNTGTLPTCSGSLIYVLDNRFTNDVIIPPVLNSIQYWIGDGFAHDPASFFGAELLSGDFYWIDSQQSSATYAWMQPNAGTPGSGFQKTLFVPMNVCCGLQGRGTAWAQNALLLMAQFTPDTNPVLPWSKSMVRQYLTNTWAGTQSWKTGFLDNTGGGTNFYTTNGPHWLADLISFPPWQQSFAMMTLAHAREINILDSDGLAEYNWFASNAVQVATDPTVYGQWLSTGYYGDVHTGNTTTCPSPYNDAWTYVNTWQDYYKANALIHPDAAVLFEPRATANTATLSATSGTSVTVSLFNNGSAPFHTHAFYVGGWVESNDGGRGQITSVIDDYTVIIDTTVTKAYANSSSGCALYSGAPFGATSYAGGFYHIPNPAPGDFLGTNWTSNAGGFDFTDLMQRSAGFSQQYGDPSGALAYSTMLGYTGGVPKTFYPIKWTFVPRSVLP
jgi:hypothetical protein